MISKERVRHMTKLAAYEEREGKQYYKMTQYFRGDYVGMELIKSFLSGTIAFAIMLGMWMLCRMETLMEELNENLMEFGIGLLVKYLVFIALYEIATYVIYNMRYTRGRKKIKLFYNRLKKVSQLYEIESRTNNPEDFD